MSKHENVEKCSITNLCHNKVYSEKKYLSKIVSPSIRSTITKLRVDVNSTLDCKFRSFRFKNIPDMNCPHCNTKQNVEHVLIDCKHPEVVINRNVFMDKYCKYSTVFLSKPKLHKIKEILDVEPVCKKESREKAIEAICMYIKKVYWIMENKINTK